VYSVRVIKRNSNLARVAVTGQASIVSNWNIFVYRCKIFCDLQVAS